jgi:hypothetical protein
MGCISEVGSLPLVETDYINIMAEILYPVEHKALSRRKN